MTVQGIPPIDVNVKGQEKAAKQSEAIFLQSMLKSICIKEHFLKESSPFKDKNQKTFQDALESQHINVPACSENRVLEMTIEQTNPVNTLCSDPMDNNKPNTTVDDFVRLIWPKAKQAASLIGLDPKILIAQAALETGWGKLITKDIDGSSTHNLFNIKTGRTTEFDSVQVKTTEYFSDNTVKINASFRKYSSIESSFNDYISLIRGDQRYQSALASTSNPDLYVKELHKAGYATDPDYSDKILSIYHGLELNQAIKRFETYLSNV